MRIAVTGGTGFIGTHLAWRLATDGHKVVLLARGKDRREETIIDMKRMTFVPSDQIRNGLPERGAFTLRDLRCCA